MTLTAATGHRPLPVPTSRLMRGAPAPRPAAPLARVPMRSFEIAALRKDGSLFIGAEKAPAIHLFESAFSAFARGTLIATPDGDVAIEDLQPGDMITTAEGKSAKLLWIGASTFVPADAGRRMPLMRIMADSFGQGRPNNFITVGPGARILQTPYHLRGDVGAQRMLTPVREFVDGENVIEVVPPTPVRLFHICLERHAAVIAGGIEMESFHPGANAARTVTQSLRDRFMAMFPHLEDVSGFGPLAYPRAPEPALDRSAV